MVAELNTGLPIPETHPETIRAFWQAIVHSGDVHEVRALDTRKDGPNRFFGVQGGYFDNVHDLVAAVAKISALDAGGVYVSLNPVNSALLARAANRLESLKTAATDADVLRIRHLLIDVDPVRPSGISATEVERQRAIAMRDAVQGYLDDLGFPVPTVISETGNGAGLIYAVGLPNDAESRAHMDAVLRSLSSLFSTPEVTIDTAVGNPSRGTRIVGTVNAKGDQVGDRVWRRVTGRFAAHRAEVSRELLTLLGRQGGGQRGAQPTRPTISSTGAHGPEETCRRLEERLSATGIAFKEKSSAYAHRIYSLDRCLTSDDHTDGAVIMIFPSAAIAYRCHHNRCQGKGWTDVRERLGFQPGSPATSTPTPNGASQGRGATPMSGSLARDVSLPAVPPFPTQVLPSIVRPYVTDAAAAIGVPDELVAVPLLAGAAACIGSTASIELKPGYEQRAIIWAAIVAPPGAAKTPAQDAGTRPVKELQHEAWLQYKQDQNEQPKLNLPLKHFFTTDATKESLANICQISPGVLLERDEFGAWVNSFDAYRGGRGGDRQDWLSFWSGKGIKVDRKSDDPLFIPRPAISVVGGIQPDMLRILRNEAGQDGFIDRILFSYPDVSPAMWSDQAISPETFSDVLNLFRYLRGADGHVAVHLSPKAERAFAEWFNDNARLTMTASPGIAGVYAKLPNQVARLALVLHCLAHSDDPRRPLSAAMMDGAIELGEYFRAHAHRVHTHFGLVAPTPIVRLEARIERALEREGEWTSRRGLHAVLGGHVPAVDLTAALESLKVQGMVECRTVSTVSKPAEEWRLIRLPESTEPT